MLFDLFRRKKNKDTDDIVLFETDEKRNRMWDL